MFDPVTIGLGIATGGSLLLAACSAISASRARHAADCDAFTAKHTRRNADRLASELHVMREQKAEWCRAASDLANDNATLVRDMFAKEAEIVSLRARCQAAEDRVHARKQFRVNGQFARRSADTTKESALTG